jgi:hypothetical protein
MTVEVHFFAFTSSLLLSVHELTLSTLLSIAYNSLYCVCAGIMCLGRYCAGESMIDRLNTMANAHIQTGRYTWGPMSCVTGGYDKRRINFERAFVQTPLVVTSIFHYDLCHFGGYNRVTTNVESTDANGFTSIAQTWADTRLHSSGIEVSFPFRNPPNCPAALTCPLCALKTSLCEVTLDC